jgi:hypothetical protein
MGLGPKTIAAITAATSAGGTQVVSTQTLCVSAYIEADGGNAGTIYVGDSNVSATRYVTNLAAGKGIWIPNVFIGPSRPDASNLDLSLVYVIGSADTQKVHVSYFERLGGLT